MKTRVLLIFVTAICFLFTPSFIENARAFESCCVVSVDDDETTGTGSIDITITSALSGVTVINVPVPVQTDDATSVDVFAAVTGAGFKVPLFTETACVLTEGPLGSADAIQDCTVTNGTTAPSQTRGGAAVIGVTSGSTIFDVVDFDCPNPDTDTCAGPLGRTLTSGGCLSTPVSGDDDTAASDALATCIETTASGTVTQINASAGPDTLVLPCFVVKGDMVGPITETGGGNPNPAYMKEVVTFTKKAVPALSMVGFLLFLGIISATFIRHRRSRSSRA